MKKIVFYVVKPKAILVDRASAFDEAVGQSLTEVTTWLDEEMTHSSWSDEEYIIAVGLIYLAYLYEDFKDEPATHNYLITVLFILNFLINGG